MIDEVATFKLYGYTSDSLSKGSGKHIVRVCKCGKVDNHIKFIKYNKAVHPNLCRSCSLGGKNNSFYGKKHSDEQKVKWSKSRCGKKHKPRTDDQKLNYSKSKMGDKNPMYNKKFSNIHLKNLSEKRKYRIGELSPNWKNGIGGIRDHAKHERNCIQLNFRFIGSDAHHLISGVVIYLPKYLHNRKYSISHDLKNNKNMKEINTLAMNYLVGDF